MTQILKSLQLPITGFTPDTPPPGFGTIYASSSNKFYFKNPAGTEFDLVTTNGYINTLYYTGSNIGGPAKTYIWSKPPGLKYIEVCCVGAGGGGGSGRKATTIRNFGGFGGGGGAIVWATFEASILAGSYDIVVGAGGAGGIGQTTNNTNGNNGSAGGTSSFGTLVIARGGDGGRGGVTTENITTLGGRAVLCTPAGTPYAINGCHTTVGGALNPFAPSNTTVALSNTRQSIIFNPLSFLNVNDAIITGGGPRSIGFGGGAGGNGGTYNGNIPEVVSASRGSNGYQFDTLILNSGDTGSASPIDGGNATSPTDNMITTLLQFTGSTTLYGLGGGGHGGGTGITGNGGNGSPGGLYGAGGGGGGTVFNNTPLSSSGAGASGSSGLVIIVEFY